MTYGWALLVVLIAIGALAYLGVLNPTRFVPDKCTIGPGFSCIGWKVDAKGDVVGGTFDPPMSVEGIIIIIKQGTGSTIKQIDLGNPDMLTVSSATANGKSVCQTNNKADPLSDYNIGSELTDWKSGIQANFIIPCSSSPLGWPGPVGNKGEKFKAKLELRYMSKGVEHYKQGELVAGVEE